MTPSAVVRTALRFTHETPAQRVLFGSGEAAANVAAEAARLGATSAMVITGASARDAAQRISADVSVAGWFDEIAPHVPIGMARRARRAAADVRADLLVAIGGGSAIGAAKAVAMSAGIPILAVPTTYAGSEATDVRGSRVRAVVRTAAAAAAVGAAGAIPVIASITDAATMEPILRESDGVIHTAASATDPAGTERAFLRTVLRALDGSDRPYVHSGGAWVFGAGAALTERSPLRPPSITAWRVGTEEMVRRAPIRATIIAPGLVYDDSGGGRLELLRPDARGVSRTVGDGAQHWTTVHVADLADLYVRALSSGRRGGRYLGVAACPSVHDLAAAAAGEGRVVTETAAEARKRLGAPLAEALLLDQRVSTNAARDDLGWSPARRSAVEVLRAPRPTSPGDRADPTR